MTTLAQARRFALSLPESHEEPHFEKASFRVGGKIFATVPEGGRHLHVFVDDVVREAAVAQPGVAELRWGKQVAGVRVDLTAAGAATVRALLEAAWRRRAPKRLLAGLATTADAPVQRRKPP